MLHAGILRVGEKRSSTSALTSEVEFEVEVEVEVTETNRATNSVAKGASDSPEEGAPVQATAKAQALRVEIADLKDQLADLDYYEALGLTTDASSGEIKRAYFKSAKKFHPDTLARLGLNDLRDEAAGVFARITEAFGTLSDKGKRALYDAGGRGEPEIDTAKLAQAEKSFRKGEILLRMGNFQGALEYLESAVDLWPDEPAYQSGLGWALYKQPKPDTARAREHLETASSGALAGRRAPRAVASRARGHCAESAAAAA